MNHQRFSHRQQATHQQDGWQREGGPKENKDGLEDITPESREMLEHHLQPGFPRWPASRPGPLASLPAPGNTPINKLRSEQMAEVNDHQETGMAGTNTPLRSWPDDSQRERVGFDQLVTGQEKMAQRYQRPSEIVYEEILDAQQGASLHLPRAGGIEDVLNTTIFPLTLNTFNTALRATGMQYLLEGGRPLTVFAPTDIAFSLLHYGTIYDLLK
jgi:fasciclin domain-containing protein